MQQRTTDRIRTRVTAIRTEPIWYALYPVSYRGATICLLLNVLMCDHVLIFSFSFTPVLCPNIYYYEDLY